MKVKLADLTLDELEMAFRGIRAHLAAFRDEDAEVALEELSDELTFRYDDVYRERERMAREGRFD